VTIAERRWVPAVLGLVAMLVSVPAIGVPSKWSDEAATTSAATRSLGDLWAMMQNIDVVHGFYYAIMHVWVDVFGTSEVAMRSFSLLAIGVAAWGVAVLGRRLGGTPLMLAGALAFAVLPRVTWLAIEARSFALTVAIAVWATIVLLRALDRWRLGWWIAYAALAGFAIAVNIDVALLLAAHGVTVLLRWKQLDRPARSLISLVVAGMVAIAAASPIIVLALHQSGQIAISALTPGYVASMLGVSQYFTGATPVRDRLVEFPPTTVWAMGGTLLAVIGWALIARGAWTSRTRELAAVTVPWIVVPTVLLISYSFVDNIYSARYLSFTTPAAALLIGAGVVSLAAARVRIAAIALVVVLAAPVYVFQRIPTGKQGTDWAQAAAVVEENKQPGDSVYWGKQYGNDQPGVTISRIGFAYPEAFSDLPSLTRVASAASTASLWGPDRFLRQSAGRIRSAERIWVIGDHLGRPDVHPSRGSATFERYGLHLEQSWLGDGTDVFLWVRD
jgi:mannosyltransferase